MMSGTNHSPTIGSSSRPDFSHDTVIAIVEARQRDKARDNRMVLVFMAI